MQWNKLSHASPDEYRAIQNEKVRSFMRHQLPYSPYYREFFKKHKIAFDEIQTTDDLQRIPFSSKQDLAPTVDEPAKPRKFILQPDEALLKKHAPKSVLLKLLKGKLLGQDVKRELEKEYKPIHIHFTTGRTALPTAFGYSARDLVMLRESGNRLLDVVGVPRSTFAINGFPYAPHLAFWLCAFAMQEVGMTSIQTGGGKIMGTRKIIDALQSTKAGLATFIPGYCYHLLRQAVHEQKDYSNLSYIIFGGERVSPGLREKVKELLAQLGSPHPQIFATYAFTEGKTAWIQCNEQSGYHLYPDMEYFEVIDKDGNRVGPETPGELVYTALDWRGTCVVRYRTGDMTKGIEYRPCPHCGRTVPRIHPDLQRSSDVKEFHLTKVKGELVNLNEFYPLLSGDRGIEEWQVELTKDQNDPFGLDKILVHITPREHVAFEALATYLDKKIREEIGVSANINFMPLEELLARLGMETEVKEKRIIDNRPKL